MKIFTTTGAAALLAAPLVLTALPGRAPAAPAAGGGMDILETAIADGNFTTLVAALQATGLDAAVAGETRLTVFAPTDAAFAALPPGTVQDLLLPENLGTLSEILTYHVVAGGQFSSDVVAAELFTTLNGQRIDIEVNGSTVKIDDATLQVADIRCTNGIIHVIDTVLMPNTQTILETAQTVGGFGTLAAAVNAAGLFDALQGEGPFTVFAPNDMAFVGEPVQRLLFPSNLMVLQQVLSYHVVPGRLYAEDVIAAGQLTTLLGQTLDVTVSNGDVFIDGAQVILADVECSNGNIHVIDGLLFPTL